ncbi:MAG: tRNA (adenosine(37)-N6)-threonylcarbamoyltransferase complex dimerization subunit type 1 TsaB [Proteobacteria bacterium]|nr:tRNA (adenosine(37)-N6)-threonylcarbamoyltransferase complex dimerization subunit type 1 TsaB [Pseudomonadota bacterium]
MKLLAFDTSTETLSIAVCDGARQWTQDGAGGPQASMHLIPMLLALLDEAGLRLSALDAIVFGRGPGSFTGLRTACAVAQGLAFGASLPLLPVDTLLAVAEDARERHGAARVHALLDARMGEIYLGDYAHDGERWRREGEIRLLRPQDFVPRPGWALAGNAFEACGDALPADRPRLAALPTAAALLRVAPGLLALGAALAPEAALPLYIRDKVAKTSDERAAERAAREAAVHAAAPATVPDDAPPQR